MVPPALAAHERWLTDAAHSLPTPRKAGPVINADTEPGTTRSPLVLAHRGASGYRPEHTARSLQLAVAQGADGIEIDIVVSKDGVLLVRHENELSATTDIASRPEFADRTAVKVIDGRQVRGWFAEDFTWHELSNLRARERLPRLRPNSATYDGVDGILRLADVLKFFLAQEPTFVLVIEIKHATFYSSVGFHIPNILREEMRGLEQLASRIIFESFEKTVLHELAETGMNGRRIYLQETQGAAPDEIARFGADAVRYSEERTTGGLRRLKTALDGVSLPLSILAPAGVSGPSGVVRRARSVDLEIYGWTLRAGERFLPTTYALRPVRDPSYHWFRRIMAAGLDGVFTDEPDVAIRARSSLAISEVL